MVPYNLINTWNISLLVTILLSLCHKTEQEAYGDTYYPVESHEKKEINAPVFRDTETNKTVGPGDKTKLKCRVDNLGTKTVVWRKKGDEYPLTIGLFTYVGDERISVDYNQRLNEWSLIIKDVKPEDEGVYLCTISTKEHKDKIYEIKLTVKTVQVEVMGSAFIEKGNLIYIICNASGKPDPPHDVRWFKDHVEIFTDERIQRIITKKIEAKMMVSTLTVRRSRIQDRGFYTCRSTNNDAAGVEIHILDVETSNVKRGTKDGKAMTIVGNKATCTLYNIFTLSLTTVTATILIWIGSSPVR